VFCGGLGVNGASGCKPNVRVNSHSGINRIRYRDCTLSAPWGRIGVSCACIVCGRYPMDSSPAQCCTCLMMYAARQNYFAPVRGPSVRAQSSLGQASAIPPYLACLILIMPCSCDATQHNFYGHRLWMQFNLRVRDRVTPRLVDRLKVLRIAPKVQGQSCSRMYHGELHQRSHEAT
jgi:hypothetical protein